jgi:hypothetical protein
VPPDDLVRESCEVDNKFVQEHILEIVTKEEYRSINGNNFKLIDHELHSADESDVKVFCTVLRTDMFYQQNVAYQRLMLSNTIDRRFYQPIVNKFETGDAASYRRPGV